MSAPSPTAAPPMECGRTQIYAPPRFGYSPPSSYVYFWGGRLFITALLSLLFAIYTRHSATSRVVSLIYKILFTLGNLTVFKLTPLPLLLGRRTASGASTQLWLSSACLP